MFEDRKDAGIQLGKALRRFEKDQPLVLGIPRGGVETAYYVAKELGAEMVPVISRKLGYPRNPEFAMGAIAEDGSYYLSDLVKSRVGDEELNLAIRREKKEIQKRVARLRNGKPLPSLKGRTVVVVDDGIATGATLFATIELCRKQHPRKLVVAAPISGTEAARELHNLVDEVVILTKPENFSAVSQGYQSFYNLNDAETLEFLRLRELEHK